MLNKLGDDRYLGTLREFFKTVFEKYPEIMKFLELYCGFYMPIMISDPYKIAYENGKRDVILFIKTLIRDDVDIDDLADFYKKHTR